MSDLHGDLIATFTTALATSTAYDPFGAVTARTGAATRLGYQGEYTDPDTGKVNMHARWYQPGTGTFTSRDTAILNPNPSVQANRYTYANASPMTGIDPTGLYTASTGMGHGDAGGYSDDVCAIRYGISLCGGGDSGYRSEGSGPVACSGAGLHICGAPDFSAVADADPEWYYENFILPTLSATDDEEAKRIGVMSNGMPAPDGFEDLTAKQRADFSAFASWVNHLNPSITLEELIGGASTSGGGMAGPGQYASLYQRFVKHDRAISYAAKEHGVSKNALLAVLVYEGLWAETTLGSAAAERAFKAEGRGASLGITQLEVYRARSLLKKYYAGQKYKGKSVEGLSDRQIADLLIYDAPMAIRLAAARMRHLKETIRVAAGPQRSGQENGTRPITDWEAALAYCGCAGSEAQFQKWVEGGYRDSDLRSYTPENRESLKKRLAFMNDKGQAVADDYWAYVKIWRPGY